MAVIPIDTLLPTSGAVPSNGYDPVSAAVFTEWEIGDAAHFSLVLPETYVEGNDCFLRLQESSAEAMKRHRWDITTLLVRPGTHATNQSVESESVTVEYVSDSDPNRLSTRTFAVTGSGQAGRLSDVALQGGDLLAFVLGRAPSSAEEDPSSIRLLDLAVTIRVDELAASDCAGRVGTIFDTVRDLFNEATGGFLPDSFILRAANRCLQDLAQAGYWRKESWIPCSSGQSATDLLTLAPGYQDLFQVHFSGRRAPMTPLGSYAEYEELRTGSMTPGTPGYFVVQNGSLHVWPPPALDAQSGFCIYHSYLPDDLTCSEINPNPMIPRAHDMVLVYYVLMQAYLRDRHAPGADTKFVEYARLYENEKHSLLGAGEPPKLSLRPAR